MTPEDPAEKREDMAALIDAVRAGDARAWEALVRRYEGLVMAVARQNGLREDDAADVFQSTWTSLFEQLDHIREPAALPGWILTTARRQAWRTLHRRLRGVAAPEGEDEPPEPADEDAADPHATSADLERRLLVRECLVELDDRCRTLLHRLYLDRQRPSYEDVGAELGLAVGTIGPLRARCLAHLLELAERRGLDP